MNLTHILVIIGVIVAVARAINHVLAIIAGVTATTKDDELNHTLSFWIRRIQQILDALGLKSNDEGSRQLLRAPKVTKAAAANAVRRTPTRKTPVRKTPARKTAARTRS